jgi:micrococcal nuclease
VLSVYDGDTITAMLDMGLDVQKKAKCRFLGIDTPELRTKSASEKKLGYAARDRLRDLILGKAITLQSVAKPDKYGRLLVRVWSDGEFINDLMIEEGLARVYDGGKRQPW